jgi:hypothetical protein
VVVSRKAIAAAGLSAIAIAAGGCSGDSDAEAEFRAAFKENFGETTWYHHITGIEVADGSGRAHIEVTTDLGPGNGETDGTICGTVMNFAVDSGAYDEIPTVRVMGSDGVLLGGCL